MNSAQRLKKLNDTGRTIFTMQDIRMLWAESPHAVRINAVRMVERGLIYRVARGYYALRDDFNKYELANLIVAPSYVSFQSAISYGGVSFQERGTVESAAKFNYSKTVGAETYIYYALKETLLFNQDGILNRDGISYAVPERAILDCLYLGFLPDIDLPDKINASYLKKLSLIYPKTVQKKAEAFL